MKFIIFCLLALKSLSEPIYSTYINRISSWEDPDEIMKSLALYDTNYNIINLAFWTANRGPFDIVKFWQEIGKYLSMEEIQKKFPEVKTS